MTSCGYCGAWERCPCGCDWGICPVTEGFTDANDGVDCSDFEPTDAWNAYMESLMDDWAEAKRDAIRERGLE